MSSPFQFEDFPRLRDLLADGGVPGVEYLYCLGKNLTKAQADGFALLRNVPAFEVSGHSFVCMGRGDKIQGASPKAWSAVLHVDIEGEQLVRGAQDGPKDSGPEDGRQSKEVESEDRQGQTRGPQPHQKPGSRESGGNPKAPQVQAR